MSDSPAKTTEESQTEETEEPKESSSGSTNSAEPNRAPEAEPDGVESAAPLPEQAGHDESESDDRVASPSESELKQEPPATETSPEKSVPSSESKLLVFPEHLKTAKVFAEIAINAGPDGDPDPSAGSSRAALLLLVESLFWLARARDARVDEQGPLACLDGLGTELVDRALADREQLSAAKRALATDTRGGEPVQSEELDALARLIRGLIHELEAPTRAAERKKALRLTKMAGLFLVTVVLLVAGIWRLVVPPDLAAKAKMTTSSTLKPCLAPTDCGSAVFHTRLQMNPWVMYDLGAEHQLSLVKVHNRSDCCYERAVPLIVETSNDAKNWTEQARRKEVFLNWTAKINVKARYVRLRVPRQVYLHLGPVVIR